MNVSKKVPKVIRCGHFFDFLKKTEEMRRWAWVFRGHGNHGQRWTIESSLHRFLRDRSNIISPKWWAARERAALRRFKQGAHLHLLHLPEKTKTENLSWLALMQHYGAPTRLIDFSLSPAVAFFFATHAATPGDAYSVHAIHVNTVRAACFQAVRPKKGKAGPGDYYTPVDADYAIGQKQTQNFVGIFDSRLNSPRQQAQEGLFLVPSSIDLDVEGWLATAEPDAIEDHWREFRFAGSEENYERDVRQFLGIALSPAGMFPGLEGLAQSARYSWFDLSRNYHPNEV